MHHLANDYSITKLCHSREQDSAGMEGVPMYDCLGEEAVFMIVVEVWICLYARGWMNLDSLRFGIK